MALKIRHIELKEANDFVSTHHRHHRRVTGHRFSLAATKMGDIVGVCIVGRPVARNTDLRSVVEVTRLCTDGTPNACSMLYGAAARAAKALGYGRIQTFILESESGITLKATGWVMGHTTTGGSWSRAARGREDDQPTCPKVLWYKDLQ